jgi:CRP-like cAMP-binding protein
VDDFTDLKNFLKLFAPISDSEFQQLIDAAKPEIKSFRKNDYLCRANDETLLMGFVRKGLMKVFINTLDGQPYIKAFINEGRLVGPFTSFIRGTASAMYIQAVEDSTLLVMNAISTRKFMDCNPVWQEVGRKIAEFIYCEREDKEFSQMTEDAETRYARFVQTFPNLQNRVSQQDIAYYLGISPVSLSRLRAQRVRARP